ncbi:ATP phosphoribosyltransferase [Methanonatronarchaeum sp. AMET6-2]|uniref:ATP phosphoribosyltransferase n=1 Tax=Methanonatronarchaeum sp. AMET6-2 TaxID=2933293 RepID=UPI001211388E|nr:ATP phosphoribosyltransferase [Methanonatronarchaeum sp. AMET6-2]RZN62897.1 MAG: ATP phosphoribosyltransferase [Methanonatronarchaeia archaeon]UOY09827.1 ATP phosphoribosyltransferase [Methanonatronarchaeum sp. AMET6-2]
MKIAVPNKGRIHKPSIELLEKAGLHIEDKGERELFARTADPNIMLLFARTADIPEYVNDGAADIGITSLDFISETGVDVELLLDLDFGVAEIVFAVPEDSDIESPADVDNSMNIATEFPNITRNYFGDIGIEPDIIEVSGATEMTPQVGIADGIVDLTSTGTTLKVNKLRVVEKILDTSAHLIANKDSLEENNKEIREIETAVESVLRGRSKKYLMMNVPGDKLSAVKEVLPGMSGPTVMNVESEEDIVAIHVVVDESEIYQVIQKVKDEGARDILVTSIDRLVP